MAQERVIPITLSLPMGEIGAFCQHWNIIEFGLFGSILREDFNEASDIDVLVVFGEDAHPTLFDLVEMQERLQNIFDRKVDLVTRNEIEASPNYIRRKAILESAQVIFAAYRSCCAS